jgi:tetratricopeptide (TPR) repeat protein
MNKKIKSLLQQAEVYKKQGLLNEAKIKYDFVKELIQNNDTFQNKQKLIESLDKKIAGLNSKIKTVESAPVKPEMSQHVNELIKKLFSFSSKEKSEDDSALEGAIALAKFGQFEGALKEFEKLLEVESQRVSAAKNILRCHLEMGSVDNANEQLDEWQESDNLFSSDQFEKISVFYNDILDKKGLKKETSVTEEQSYTPEDEGTDEEFLDISAVAIALDNGPNKGEQVELDVSFQSGNVISLIVSSKDEHLIENLKVGVRLDDVHFYSPVAIFRGSGVVSAKTQIKSGPKKGDYSLDIKIESL